MTSLVEMSATDARRITDQIKAGVEAIWQLIEQAYTTRAWSSLGYTSWDDYCTREFGTSRIRLPREERQEVVASMRELGMSVRAIASATGMSRGQIANDVSSNGHLADAPVTGTDGKTYSPKPRPVEPEPEIDDEPDPEPLPPGFNPGDLDALNTPTPATPKRKPLTDSFFEAAYDLQKIAERIERLAADDRFEKNSGQIAQKNLGELTRSRDALQRVINQLSQA